MDQKSILKFYLNIFILNKKDVIRNEVDKTSLGKYPLIGSLVKKYAPNFITDEAFCKKVIDALIEQGKVYCSIFETK